MKIVYFDTIAGISGDMTLGAFISAGVSLDELQEKIRLLNLQGVELQAAHVQQNGITAVKVDVVISKAEHHHRHLNDIYKIIDGSALSKRVKDDAKNIFREVAQAEAKVHNSTIDDVHFHEVGALDSIVDIVGAAICFEMLGIERVYSSPVKLGSGGFIETQHGKLPLPSPATTEILKNYPVVLTDVPYELTTPTGAALIKAMSSGVLSMEKIIVQSVGYGAGTRTIPSLPNLLRVMVGELSEVYDNDELVTVETNIDNMNPEIYPFVVEQLFSAGAHDAYLVPIIMKKGRPAILLSALTSRSKLDEIVSIFFSQTSTLGVRIQPVERRKLQRSQKIIETTFGKVLMKSIVHNGKERLVPEYEECKRIANEKNVPIIEVYKILSQVQ